MPPAETTRDTYRGTLDRARSFFDTMMPAKQVRPFHIAEYLTERAKGVAPRTVEKDRTTLHTVFEWAVNHELVRVNPVKPTDAPKVDGRDPIILTDGELDKLLAACGNDTIRLYVLTLADTGMRSKSEANWLRFRDVKLDDGFVWIEGKRKGRRNKGGKARWCPMEPRLIEAMREHFARTRLKLYHGKRTEWVFHHEHDRYRAPAGTRVKSLYQAVKNAAVRAKLPKDFRPHDLRHRRITTWLAEGRDVVKVKEAVGHADLATTMGYTHLAKEHLRTLVSRPDVRRNVRSGQS